MITEESHHTMWFNLVENHGVQNANEKKKKVAKILFHYCQRLFTGYAKM